MPYITVLLPRYKNHAKKPELEDAVLLTTPKFLKILLRRYGVVAGYTDAIRSLIDYFYVSKGSDIRLMYNGKSCGINDLFWAPSFWFPIARAALRLLGVSLWTLIWESSF
jgi:hypothetical protein